MPFAQKYMPAMFDRGIEHGAVLAALALAHGEMKSVHVLISVLIFVLS